jgi:hypothetical protein
MNECVKTITNSLFLPFQPNKLISLWEMLPFAQSESILAFSEVKDILDYVFKLKQKEPAQNADKTLKNDITNHLGCAELVAAKLGLTNSSQRILKTKLNLRFATLNVSEIYTILKDTVEIFLKELGDAKLLIVSPEALKWNNQEELFGEYVNKIFPEANSEIKSAGNCLAAEENTAAVFHLMRVAELGLRRLAKSLRVRLAYQIEFATWTNITDKLDEKLRELKSTKRSISREKKLHFYSGLLLEIRAFQYLWRDPVMHARFTFDHEQAVNTFKHVQIFMATLANNLVKPKRR